MVYIIRPCLSGWLPSCHVHPSDITRRNPKQNEIRSEAYHVTFLKKHLRDLLLSLKSANGDTDLPLPVPSSSSNGSGGSGQQGRARGDSVSSVGSVDFGDLRVSAEEFNALGFLLAGGRDCEGGPEAPRLSELVPFWQVCGLFLFVGLGVIGLGGCGCVDRSACVVAHVFSMHGLFLQGANAEEPAPFIVLHSWLDEVNRHAYIHTYTYV